MYLPKSDRDWIIKHAEQRKSDGLWVCKTTGETIDVTVVGRSIWHRPFMGGSGEVRQVGHLSCPGCNPNFTAPDPGTPIYGEELIRDS